ncbi:hypothetical protein ACSBR1_031068 [Camellia fascicularis]
MWRRLSTQLHRFASAANICGRLSGYPLYPFLAPSLPITDVKDNPVILYMKGVPDLSRCGFSSLAFTEFELTLLFTDLIALGYYGILTIDMPFADVPSSARNILEDPELKNAVKAYSNWPTFPQIFIKGEFIGGSDIILNMHQTGELKEMLKDIAANQERSE